MRVGNREKIVQERPGQISPHLFQALEPMTDFKGSETFLSPKDQSNRFGTAIAHTHFNQKMFASKASLHFEYL